MTSFYSSSLRMSLLSVIDFIFTMSIVTFLGGFILCSVPAFSFPPLTKCVNNDDCHSGQFCYLDTGFCADCIGCAPYNRGESLWTKCPQKALDCGFCLLGFVEEILSMGERRDRCVPAPQTGKMNDLREKSTFEQSTKWFLLFGTFGMIVAVGTVTIKKMATVTPRERQRSQSRMEQLPPPPYDLLSISFDSEFRSCKPPETIVGGPDVYGFSHSERVTEAMNKASWDTVTLPTEVRDEENARPGEPNIEIDEDTMPSDWTPDRPEEAVPVEANSNDSTVQRRHFFVLSAEAESQQPNLSLNDVSSSNSQDNLLPRTDR